MPNMPGSGLFTLVPIFIGLVFLFVIGSIVFGVIKNLAQWSENNAQPVANEEARLVTKRTEVSSSRERSTTRYYLTFELASGVRREFSVSGSEYGLQAEGDSGQLRFQGTRYLGFTRSLAPREDPQEAAPANLVCNYCGSAIPSGSIKCGGCGSIWRPKVANPEAA